MSDAFNQVWTWLSDQEPKLGTPKVETGPKNRLTRAKWNAQLWTALVAQDANALKMALDNDADPNFRGRKNTQFEDRYPLQVCLEMGWLEGANTLFTHHEKTPLVTTGSMLGYAITSGKEETLDWVLTHFGQTRNIFEVYSLHSSVSTRPALLPWFFKHHKSLKNDFFEEVFLRTNPTLVTPEIALSIKAVLDEVKPYTTARRKDMWTTLTTYGTAQQLSLITQLELLPSSPELAIEGVWNAAANNNPQVILWLLRAPSMIEEMKRMRETHHPRFQHGLYEFSNALMQGKIQQPTLDAMNMTGSLCDHETLEKLFIQKTFLRGNREQPTGVVMTWLMRHWPDMLKASVSGEPLMKISPKQTLEFEQYMLKKTPKAQVKKKDHLPRRL